MISMRDEHPTIVIDNGTDTIKAGFSGNDQPDKVIKTLAAGNNQDGYTFGDETAGQCINPIHRGIITDWDAMGSLWNHILVGLLKVQPEHCSLLVTDTASNPQNHREHMIQIMFEQLSCQTAYICLQEVLALYSTGKKSGIIINSGEGRTTCVPVCEGYVLPYGIRQLEFAGQDITLLIKSYLSRVYHQLSELKPQEINSLVRDVKHQHSTIRVDSDRFPSKQDEEDIGKTAVPNSSSYALPDQTILDLTKCDQISLCYEQLFTAPILPDTTQYSPRLTQLVSQTCSRLIHLPGLIYDIVRLCDFEYMKELYSNIVLAGGTTCVPNFAHRLIQEVNMSYVPTSIQVKIAETTDPLHAAWFGGGILTSLSIFQNAWITRKDYDETGPTIIHRKCIN